jgi:hypothetical protein
MSKVAPGIRFRPDARGVSGKWGRSSPTSEKAQSISVERRARTAGVWGRSRSRGGSAAPVGASWQVRYTLKSRSKDNSERRCQFRVNRAEIGYREPVAPLDVEQGCCAEKGLPRNAASKTSR